MAIFGPKQWVNTIGLMSIFRLLELVVFKRHFPGLYSVKKKLENWKFLDQNHELFSLEKRQLLTC